MCSRSKFLNSLPYKPFSTSTDYFKFSFFPHTVVLGMLYHLILSLLLLWISSNHRSKPTTTKQFSILYRCKYVTCFLINCKYMVCSHRCIVVTIDGTLYNVDVNAYNVYRDLQYGRYCFYG